jgi:DNA primase
VNRVDTVQLRRDHPVADIVTRYGVELHRCGSALVGRCPFHDDGGRPNLYVYPETERWYCYRCSTGGDVLTFVERMEGVDFRGAVERLLGERPSGPHAIPQLPRRMRSSAPRPRRHTPVELPCLAVAVDLYQRRLAGDERARAYVERRGLDQATRLRYRLGYARGDELEPALSRRRIPPEAAIDAGLLRADGREMMAGRIVVPEIRQGRPTWLIGRVTEPQGGGPKYLALAGPKPLLGWEEASTQRSICLVEGPFDWLLLRQWGFPALALVGTHVRPVVLDALDRFECIYLCLDADEAGELAAAELALRLGSRARRAIVPNVKDVAELAHHPDGPAIFAAALERSELAQVA